MLKQMKLKLLEMARLQHQTMFLLENGNGQSFITPANGTIINPQKVTLLFVAFPTSDQTLLERQGLL